MTELWTLDELTGLVGAALATDHPGPPNGRVRAIPDQRAIRWYTTIGLVDRPAEMRGRTAFYGRRHLLQLVAIKRRQAAGLALAQIQAELSGATDDQLQAIASLPENLPAEPPGPPTARLDTPTAHAGTPAAHAGTPTSPNPRAASAVLPAGTESAGRDGGAVEAGRGRFWAERPVAEPGPGPLMVTAIRVSEGVTVVIDRDAAEQSAPQLSAVRAAAQPLIAELTRQGLLTSDPGDPR